jgi:hypothetical protein
MPTVTTINAEGAFTRDIKDTVNNNFAAVNGKIDQATPASAGAAGVKGTIVYDGSFLYICSATNTWLKVAIATW